MALWLFAGVGQNASQYGQLTTQAERTGYAAGTGIAVVMILIVWVLGTVIFGLLAYFTRGPRELIEIETN